jgi:hypothetical protein
MARFKGTEVAEVIEDETGYDDPRYVNVSEPETKSVRIVTITDTNEYQVMQDWYMDEFPAVAEDSSMIHAQIVSNILEQGADSVLDVREALDSAGNWIGKPIELEGIESVMPSSYGGIFVLLRFRPYDITTKKPFGEVERMAVGSPQMLAQLHVLHAAGKLAGCACKVVPIKKGGSNGRNAPLYFRRVDY